MKLQRREQANNPARNALANFSEAMILRDLGIRKRVETSGFFYEKAPILEAL
jgi:hypothetical protein